MSFLSGLPVSMAAVSRSLALPPLWTMSILFLPNGYSFLPISTAVSRASVNTNTFTSTSTATNILQPSPHYISPTLLQALATEKSTGMNTTSTVSSTTTSIKIDVDAPEELYSNVFDITPDDDSRFSLPEEHVTLFDEALKYFPMVLPILAYLAYDPTAELFATILDSLSQNKWVVVDGGAYQAKIIAPAINGVVVPAISILFANLIATTVNTLRQRQLDIRTCLNMEAGQLRILQSLLDSFPQHPQDSSSSLTACRRYLTQYTTRLIAESQPTMTVESLDYSLDTELNGVLVELNKWASSSSASGASGASGASSTSSTTSTSSEAQATSSSSPPTLLLNNAYTAVSNLYEERAKRIAALRSLFPPLHFMILSALAMSICMAFLLETKQDILVFLNAIQLRILWTMLVGTFTALGLVCYDLGHPFRGSYQITKSVHQLYTIRMTLRASLVVPLQQQQQQDQQEKEQQEKQSERQEIVSSDRHEHDHKDKNSQEPAQ